MGINWYRGKSRQRYHALPIGSSRALCGRWWLSRNMHRVRKDLPADGDICKTCADINDKRSKTA
jgi:hypothetical protein